MRTLPRNPAFVVLSLAFMAASATGQQPSSARLAELKALDAELTAQAAVVPSQRGQDAIDKLDGWKLDTSALNAEQRAQVLRCYIYASLAIGDARSALGYLSALQAHQPDARQTLCAALMAGIVSGDGKFAADTLRKLSEVADDTARSQATEGLRRLKLVATRPPDQTIKAGDDEVSLVSHGGVALVVMLWNLRQQPNQKQLAAMLTLYDSVKENTTIRFVSVSANAPGKGDEARTFARANKLSWPLSYEPQATGAPITHKAFQAGAAPMMVVIDGDGVIRAAGDVDDPALAYAVRAVAAEEAGRFPPPELRTVDGKAAQRQARPATKKTGEAESTAGDKRKTQAGADRSDEKPKAEKSGEPRNDEAAEAKMREARLMFKTGHRTKAKELFQEIVKNYPGTIQAKQAQEYLDSMP